MAAGKEAPPSMAHGADRISSLPDGVRERVLSFLPAHEAVRTAVLARCWRDVWMRSPALRITAWGRSFATFSEFASRLLRLRFSPQVSSSHHPDGHRGAAPAPVDSCHFDFGPSDFGDDENVVIDLALAIYLIKSALRCNVRVLRFCFSRNRRLPLEIPDLTLVSQHLRILELAGVCVGGRLHLSGCPALMDLKMEKCFLRSNEIRSPYLRNLSIIDCYFLMNRTRIGLHSLVSLNLTRCQGRAPLLESMPSLATAIVTLDSVICDDKCVSCSIDGCGNDICPGCRYYYYKSSINPTSCLLLGALSEATNLELSAYPEVVVFIRDLKFARTFSKLKALVLTDWFVVSDLTALIWFLHHSPVLENLTLQLSKVHKTPMGIEGRRKLPEHSLASSHINIVEIKCHEVDEIVIEI